METTIRRMDGMKYLTGKNAYLINGVIMTREQAICEGGQYTSYDSCAEHQRAKALLNK